MKKHAPDCILDPVYWLQHAVAAAGRLIADGSEAPRSVDKVAAMSLTDTLAHFAELPNWRTTTLLDLAEHATLMTDDGPWADMCTCGAHDD